MSTMSTRLCTLLPMLPAAAVDAGNYLAQTLDAQRPDAPGVEWAQLEVIAHRLCVDFQEENAGVVFSLTPEGSVLVQDNGGEANVMVTAHIVKELLALYAPTDTIDFEYAVTCAPAIPNAFGGGAVVVTAQAVHSLTSNDAAMALYEKIRQALPAQPEHALGGYYDVDGATDPAAVALRQQRAVDERVSSGLHTIFTEGRAGPTHILKVPSRSHALVYTLHVNFPRWVRVAPNRSDEGILVYHGIHSLHTGWQDDFFASVTHHLEAQEGRERETLAELLATTPASKTPIERL